MRKGSLHRGPEGVWRTRMPWFVHLQRPGSGRLTSHMTALRGPLRIILGDQLNHIPRRSCDSRPPLYPGDTWKPSDPHWRRWKARTGRPSVNGPAPSGMNLRAWSLGWKLPEISLLPSHAAHLISALLKIALRQRIFVMVRICRAESEMSPCANCIRSEGLDSLHPDVALIPNIPSRAVLDSVPPSPAGWTHSPS